MASNVYVFFKYINTYTTYICTQFQVISIDDIHCVCCYRINKITFNFTLFTFFRDDIIEDEAAVHAKFHVRITLVNDLYSSMTVDIDIDSKLTRYCDSFRKGTTIVDMVIIILLIISSFTYINSFINTYKLSKVGNYLAITSRVNIRNSNIR